MSRPAREPRARASATASIVTSRRSRRGQGLNAPTKARPHARPRTLGGVISAKVLRALAVSGQPVTEPCAACGRRTEPTLESLVAWLVQRRQRGVELTVLEDGTWRAVGRWPGPERELEAEGQSPADALAKIALEIASRDRPPAPE